MRSDEDHVSISVILIFSTLGITGVLASWAGAMYAGIEVGALIAEWSNK